MLTNSSVTTNLISIKNHLLKVIFLFFILLFQFSFSVARAEDSLTVANQLNALYNKKDGCKGDNPDYYCSGVILHAEAFQNIDQPWYLSHDRDVGSFSYLREDIVSHVGLPIFITWPYTGFILTPQNELQNTQQFPYEVYCSYPMNGGTVSRLGKGCGDFKLTHPLNKHIDYSTCTKKNVFSINDYMDKFTKQETVNVSGKVVTLTHFKNFGEACSFSPNKDGFKLSMALSKYLFRDHPEIGSIEYVIDASYGLYPTHNELIVSAWPKEQVSVLHVPIKAIFVVINSGTENVRYGKEGDKIRALQSAFATADAYSHATNQSREIPVVIIDMQKIKDGSPDVFSPATRPQSSIR